MPPIGHPVCVPRKLRAREGLQEGGRGLQCTAHAWGRLSRRLPYGNSVSRAAAALGCPPRGWPRARCPPPGGSGGLGWAPTDTGTSPKLGVMEVGGVTRSEGESNKNAVMFARGLGLQKSLNNNRFLSLHAGGVWWGYSFLQGFNPSAPGVTSGKSLGQLDRSSKTL